MTRTPAAAAAALLLAGCSFTVNGGAFGPGVEVTETTELPAAGAKTLAVDSRAGSIDAAPSAADGVVRVTAVKHAPTEADLARIHVTAAVEGDEVRVGHTVDGSTDGISVSYRVEAPRGLHARLTSGAGSVRASGFEGGLEARSGAGSIAVEGVRGDLRLETSAGSIRVQGADGAVVARSGAGSIDVAGTLRGTCSLETDAGSVEAALPLDSRLKVDGSTGAGSVRTDFPLAVTGKYAARGLSGTLGDGTGGTLRMRSDAGSITLCATR
jgi:DUF4097 and DUF4098 domain-containing protein YvlB